VQVPEYNRQHYEAAGLAEVDWDQFLEQDKQWPACDWCDRLAADSTPSLIRIMDSIFGGPFHLVQCRRCGLRFVWPRPREEWVLERIGKSTQTAEALGPTEWATRYYNHVAAILCAHPDFPYRPERQPKVFDIGCGRGNFLREMHARGWKTYGCDRDLHCAHISPKPYGFWGIPFQDFSREDRDALGPFDAVTMFDYLEHSYGPALDLQYAWTFLRPHGLLVIKTFLDELDHEHKMLAPPVHLYHFTEDVLLRMIEDTGFVKPMVLHDGPGGVMATVIAEKA
jgi:2-polyprenyl-3-methyl-5-hydroxy-6-metoxy-1,4-benzoquinol methylase